MPEDAPKEKDIDASEKDFLLAEYQALREEILSRTGRQTQITTLAIVLLGGLLAIVPFKLFSDLQSINLNNPLVITELLIVSGLFISILWVFMEQEMRVINAAHYIHNGIRVRAALLQNVSREKSTTQPWDKELGILNWDKYLLQTSEPEDLLSILIFIIRVGSRYVVMAAPAILSLTGAILIYKDKHLLYINSPLNIINQIFFVLDILYFLSAVGFAFYMKFLQARVLRTSKRFLFKKVNNNDTMAIEATVDESSILPINNKGIPTTLVERRMGRKIFQARALRTPKELPAKNNALTSRLDENNIPPVTIKETSTAHEKPKNDIPVNNSLPIKSKDNSAVSAEKPLDKEIKSDDT